MWVNFIPAIRPTRLRPISFFLGSRMRRVLELVADWSDLLHRYYVPVFDAVYVPLRRVFGHGVAYFVADVLLGAAMILLLEPVAWWLAKDVIRARW